MIYGNSRTFLDLEDAGRVHPVTGVREERPPPALRTAATMRAHAFEYERLLRESPSEAPSFYAAHGQGELSPLFNLPYAWSAVPDGMHVVLRLNSVFNLASVHTQFPFTLICSAGQELRHRHREALQRC